MTDGGAASAVVGQNGGDGVAAIDLSPDAAAAGEDLQGLLRFAADAGAALPRPGTGSTGQRWQQLAAVARANLTAARVLEAHSDALAILAEADDEESPAGTWGVFAAESPPDRLVATRRPDGTATLTGVKPWCSLGGALDHALVTAHVDDGRALFRVDLQHASVTTRPSGDWVARGLRAVPSVPLVFDATPARAVGAPGWYVDRPGFAWGGMGVAACWYGGALGVADTLRRHASSRRNEITLMHVGSVDAALHAAAQVLSGAAEAVDSRAADGSAGATLALRVRSVVADTVERVLRSAAHALGPAPLAFDADHAARVADLQIYVRQHHAERDLAALGAAVLDQASDGRRVTGEDDECDA